MKNIPDISMEMGRRMRKLRKLQGLTQEELADRAVLNVSYYGEIERGRKNITVRILQKITAGLDVTLGELLRFPTETPLTEEGEELVALVTRLLQKGSKRKIRMVLALLKEMVG